MNLGKDVLVADLGASAVEMGNAQQQALEDQQLAAGYSVSYPSGFGTQRVIRIQVVYSKCYCTRYIS